MQIGMIGLGRMGANMARRLMRGGHACVVHNRTEERVRALGRLLSSGDVVVDGGNSYFKDDVRRARTLKEAGIFYVDAGTSGGVWGLERGYCLMIGGERRAVERLAPVFRTLAPGRGVVPPAFAGGTASEGWLYCGPSGAGHFVKMVHNGIEYGIMESYAEGFDVLKGVASPELPEDRRYDLPLAEDASLYKRFLSRRDHTFAERLLSAMRERFGGHLEPKAEP